MDQLRGVVCRNIGYLREFTGKGNYPFYPKMENVLNEVSIEFSFKASLPEIEVISRISSIFTFANKAPLGPIHAIKEITNDLEGAVNEFAGDRISDVVMDLCEHMYRMNIPIYSNPQLFPVGSTVYEGSCVFRGMSILVLAGGDLSAIMETIDYNIDPSGVDKESFIRNTPILDKTSDALYQLFWKAIVTAWNADLSENRLKTFEWLIKNRYYTDANPVVVRELSFAGCRLSCNFINAVETTLDTELCELSVEYKKITGLKGSSKRDIEIELSCYTTVFTYYHILICNRKYVINQQPVNTLLNSRVGYVIPDSTLSALGNTIVTEYTNNIGEVYGKFADNPEYSLMKKNELLPGIAGISYDLRIPLSEIDLFISNMRIVNSEVTEIENTCKSVKEIWDFYNK